MEYSDKNMSRCYGCMEEKNTTSARCPRCGYMDGTMPREQYHMTPGITLHGKYLVGKVLGYGGFGVTYIGWDLTLERKVAIKEYFTAELANRSSDRMMVQPLSKSDSRFGDGLKRFIEEAQCLARFNHVKGIVDVYEVFIDNNTGYIVMEYLEGETLRNYLKRTGPMPYESARLIISEVLKTLSEVHKMGIIHRDVAPDNIIITLDNTVKLLDFGAARVAAKSENSSHQYSVVLKHGYAPEEQYRAKGAQGTWTDVYAVAATLYKMITGVTPVVSVDRLVKDTLKSPQELGIQIPVGANMALMKAMHVQEKKRTQTVWDFLWELG